MSKFYRIAKKLDDLGFRRLVARLANLAYKGRRFSVDRDGFWVNEQPDCTIVSPIIHTARYEAFRDWVLGEYTYAYRPKKGDVIIDVGSGMGEEAVVFSKLVGPSGLILAIEAHPRTFRALERTVERSGLTNVTPVHCAVGDENGEVSFGEATSYISDSIFRSKGGQKVPLRTIDSLVEEYDLARIDYLRMNIEGAEKLAVKGMKDHIPRNIFISCHDFMADDGHGDTFRSRAIVKPALRKMGFKLTTRPTESGKPWLRDYLYGAREQVLVRSE